MHLLELVAVADQFGRKRGQALGVVEQRLEPELLGRAGENFDDLGSVGREVALPVNCRFDRANFPYGDSVNRSAPSGTRFANAGDGRSQRQIPVLRPPREARVDRLAGRASRRSDVVVVESDEDVLLYHTGHIPGAIKIDWVADLNDPLMRDYLDAEGFASLMSKHGIGPETTVVFYGDNFNWWAAYALWVFALFGHADTRLLDGGRTKWIAEGREVSTDEVTQSKQQLSGSDSSTIVRSERFLPTFCLIRRMPCLSSMSAHRKSSGASDCTCPTTPTRAHCAAVTSREPRNVPWKKAANDDNTFKSLDDLRGALPGRGRTQARRRCHRLLPDRRAVIPHLVRAHPAARLRPGAELRRVVDRVRQRRPSTD